MITLDSINGILALGGLVSLVILIFIITYDGKDERGKYIQNYFFKIMFFILTFGISFNILFSSWVDVSYEIFRNMVAISFSGTYIVGLIILLVLRRRF